MTKPYIVEGIQRPRTRADCVDAPRPCPWASCRHHLLLEVSKSKPKDERDDPRATTIRINRAPSGAYKLGRRAGMPANAASNIVRQWIADAAETLFAMPATCSLDIVEAYPDGIPPSSVAYVLGMTEPTIDQELRKPEIKEALADLGRDFFMDPKRMGRRNTAPTGSAATVIAGRRTK